MQPDTTTRYLLAGILICLGFLILQNILGGGRANRSQAVASAPAPRAAEPARPSVHGELGEARWPGPLTDADLILLRDTVSNEALPVDMRVFAALQLERVRHPAVTEALIAELDAPDQALATAALQALAGYPHPQVLEAARRAVESDDAGVRTVGRYVLESLGEAPPEG